MIRRIVKMSFAPEKLDDFLDHFPGLKLRIEAFPGCNKVELLNQKDNKNILFTISIWGDEKALENYRQSDFFRETWTRTKKLFNDKPQAWSLELLDFK